MTALLVVLGACVAPAVMLEFAHQPSCGSASCGCCDASRARVRRNRRAALTLACVAAAWALLASALSGCAPECAAGSHGEDRECRRVDYVRHDCLYINVGSDIMVPICDNVPATRTICDRVCVPDRRAP